MAGGRGEGERRGVGAASQIGGTGGVPGAWWRGRAAHIRRVLGGCLEQFAAERHGLDGQPHVAQAVDDDGDPLAVEPREGGLAADDRGALALEEVEGDRRLQPPAVADGVGRDRELEVALAVRRERRARRRQRRQRRHRLADARVELAEERVRLAGLVERGVRGGARGG